jgi:hypothetical protein
MTFLKVVVFEVALEIPFQWKAPSCVTFVLFLSQPVLSQQLPALLTLLPDGGNFREIKF